MRKKKLWIMIAFFVAVLMASTVTVIVSFSRHAHTFREAWTYDDTDHWHEATCGHTCEVSGKAKHDFRSGSITTAPTCDAEGVRTLRCACGATKTETVARAGHAYEWETQSEATCVNAAILKGTCSVCGATTVKDGNLSEEHLWGGWHVIKAATCTEVGQEERVCSRDHAHKETRDIPLKQHEYTDYNMTKAPTVSAEGEMKAKCGQCGKVVTLKILMTPQLTRSNTELSWKPVGGAKGYKLYDKGILAADLGNALSYEIPSDAAAHSYAIEAYTDRVSYHGVSLRSNVDCVAVSLNENFQASKGTDFEGFFTPFGDLLTTGGWKADGSGDVIFVSEGALENEIVTEANGNKCFKFYTAKGPSTFVNFAGNTAFAEAGLYKMSVKVKLGAAATRVNNIGFRFHAKEALGTGDIQFQGLEKLNSSDWVTLEAYFIVPKSVSTNYINMNFWVFTHNDEIGSTDNYVLMDDVAVYAVDVSDSHTCEWKTESAATCDRAEILKGTCDFCGVTTTKEGSPATGHAYEEYEITKAPTTTTEGEMRAKCKNDPCGEILSLKILMTPQLVLDKVNLTWEAVPSAIGYKLYDNDRLVADLGGVLSYEVPSETVRHSYSIEAYTDDGGYHSVSLRSNAVSVAVSLGDNLQALKGTDFEEFEEKASVEIVKKWVNDCYNASAGKVFIMNDLDSAYAKLLPVANAGAAILTKSCNTAVLKAGTYRLSFDVKLGGKADGAISFGIWDGKAWAPQWPKVTIDTTGANADTWTTVTYEFTLPADKTGTYANLDLAYTCVTAGEDNYVLIDNIQIINPMTNQNVDTGKHGDFEGFFTKLRDLLRTSGWKADKNGNVIFVSEGILENELVTEENGNKCFKFYTAKGTNTLVNFAGNTAIAKAGIYKMSVKVKLGPDASKVNNIGFRLHAATPLNAGDITFKGLEKLNSSEWVTLEAYFVVPKTVTTNYINMNFWVFTHNDEIGSADNYVLMDDIEVREVKTGTAGVTARAARGNMICSIV